MRNNMRFFFPIIIIFILFGLSFVIQLLWNHIISPTFSLTQFNYWQAMGLFAFCRILFGGFKFGPFPNHQAQKEKWRNMSEEERTKFKEEWRKRCQKQEKE